MAVCAVIPQVGADGVGPPSTDVAGDLRLAVRLIRACRFGLVDADQLPGLLVLARDGERALQHLLVDLAGRADRLAADGSGPGGAELLVGSGEVPAVQAREEAARADAVRAFPLLGSALGEGTVGAGHVDAVARATRNLTEPEVGALSACEPELVAAAVGRPVDTFRRWLGRRVGQIRDEHRVPGADLEVEEPPSVRAWRGRDGRGHLALDVDPVTFDLILGILDQSHQPVEGVPVPGPPNESAAGPAPCEGPDPRPVDHSEAAARRLLDRLFAWPGTGSGPAGPWADIVVIVDGVTAADGRHDGTICETSHGTPVPVATAARFACQGVLRKVVFGPGGVPMDVGRRHRTATAAQWAVLKALHRTCAWHGCDRTVEWCQAHHIDPWDPSGATDLGNLVPLCSRHHHLVHEGGWRIRLQPDRGLELVTPDGQPWHTSHPDRLEGWPRSPWG